MANTTASYIKNTADRIFSLWIRLKAADYRGYVTCVTCGVTRHYKDDMQAGHYARRDLKNTRYDEQNVHVQCVNCNKWKSGNMAAYAAFMVAKYGQEIIVVMNQRSQIIKQWKRSELQELVKGWRVEIRKMLTVKG